MNEWISVKDKLPILGELVLFCAKNDENILKTQVGNFLGQNIDTGNIYFRNITCFRLYNNISHWMPLPEPPES